MENYKVYNQRHIIAGIVLPILYTVGVVGVLLAVHPDFLLLTPVILLVSLATVLSCHQPEKDWKELAFFCGLVFIVGFTLEAVGVQTGVIFGRYQYGETLGYKWLDAPLMIGINWVLLVYITGATVRQFMPFAWPIIQAVIAAALMTLLDFLIEPVAIKYDMWHWLGDGSVPVQNYFAWFDIGFLMQLAFIYLVPQVNNRTAPLLLLLQFLFFLSLYFTALG